MTSSRTLLMVLAVILSTGLALRAYQLNLQIVTGDEWHALHKVIADDAAGIASSFGAADHSIPITLYFETLSNTIGLSHVAFYLPFVLTGMLVVGVIPALCSRYTGWPLALLLAGFLALSPYFIAYSRFARPYMPAMLLSFVAIYCFYRWQEAQRTRFAVAYAVAAGLTGFFLVAYLPFVLAPFLIFGLVALHDKNRLTAIGRLFATGLLTAVVLAALIGQPLFEDFGAIETKLNAAQIGAEVLLDAIQVLYGGAGLPLTSIMLLLATLGLVAALRHKQYFLLYLCLLGLIQTTSVLLVAPKGGDNAIIVARYILPAVIPLILLACYCLLAVSKHIGFMHRTYGAVVPAALLLTLTLMGALSKLYYSPNSAFVLNMFAWFMFGDSASEQLLKRSSAFYQRLGSEPKGSIFLVEAPFVYNLDHYFLYQKQHGQRIAAGQTVGLCGSHVAGVIPQEFPIRPWNYYQLTDVDGMRQDGVDFVVLHKQAADEVNYAAGNTAAIDMETCIAQYRSKLGLAYFEDEDLVVFSLTNNTRR